MEDHYSCVRIKQPTYKQVVDMSRHAAGNDKISEKRRRKDASAIRSVAMAFENGALGPPRLALRGVNPDYGAQFAAWKEANGVVQRKGCPVAIHALCIVSPEAIKGNGHDPHNPSVRKLLADSVSWAEREYGRGCVWAARYDVDENGSGVVDVFCSPHYKYRIGRGRPKDRIAVAQKLKESKERWERTRSYAAAQDSFNDHVRERGWEVLRGVSVEQTRRLHVSPEAYKAALEAESENKRALDAYAKQLADKEEAQIERDHAIDVKERRIAAAVEKGVAQLVAESDSLPKRLRGKARDRAAIAAVERDRDIWRERYDEAEANRAAEAEKREQAETESDRAKRNEKLARQDAAVFRSMMEADPVAKARFDRRQAKAKAERDAKRKAERERRNDLSQYGRALTDLVNEQKQTKTTRQRLDSPTPPVALPKRGGRGR